MKPQPRRLVTPLLLPVLLVLVWLVEGGAGQRAKAFTHFGNCWTAGYGEGRCQLREDCDFYAVDLLDATNKSQCHSLLRPSLICCPRESNALPILAPRLTNGTRAGGVSGGQLATPATQGLGAADELPSYPNCGISFANKIFGGSNTKLLEFPWTTLLEYTLTGGQKTHVCGASFIAQRWLLTAAHCADDFFLGGDRQLTGARLGEWNKTSNPDCIPLWNGRSECAPPHIDAVIDRILVHPQFDRNDFGNDIALLRLQQPVDWRTLRHVEPVCLPLRPEARADRLAGKAVDVSGWGLTDIDSQLSPIKRKAMLHVTPLDACRDMYRVHNFSLGESQLCAGGGIGVDSCSGDSGGPLTVEANTPQNERYVYLAGIVSFGLEQCGKTDLPAVYTRVSSYIDWIQQTLRDNSGAN